MLFRHYVRRDFAAINRKNEKCTRWFRPLFTYERVNVVVLFSVYFSWGGRLKRRFCANNRKRYNSAQPTITTNRIVYVIMQYVIIFKIVSDVFFVVNIITTCTVNFRLAVSRFREIQTSTAQLTGIVVSLFWMYNILFFK